jgi:hypothetical protein
MQWLRLRSPTTSGVRLSAKRSRRRRSFACSWTARLALTHERHPPAVDSVRTPQHLPPRLAAMRTRSARISCAAHPQRLRGHGAPHWQPLLARPLAFCRALHYLEQRARCDAPPSAVRRWAASAARVRARPAVLQSLVLRTDRSPAMRQSHGGGHRAPRHTRSCAVGCGFTGATFAGRALGLAGVVRACAAHGASRSPYAGGARARRAARTTRLAGCAR